MKTLLLTGGAGYIGSHTLLKLAELQKYNLVVFDDLVNGNKDAVDIIRNETGQKIELIQGSLLDTKEITAVFKQNDIDAVIHFAALIEAGKSVSHPTRFFENNISGSINLFKVMQQAGVQKIVFSSTAAVYGTPDTMLITEASPIKIENWYALSKRVVEQMLEALAADETDASEKIDSVILRYFNAAGADPQLRIGQDYPNPTHLMTIAIEAALGIRDAVTIFGNDYATPDGTAIRDYIHVDDLAQAHVQALKYLFQNEGTEVFNLGTGTGTSVLDVVKALEKIHGTVNWEYGARRAGDPAKSYTSNAKAKKSLNWRPKYTAEDALKHAYAWKKAYPKGFADKVKM